MTMLKLADLRWRQTRKRRPFLQGRIGPYYLTLFMRDDVIQGQELSGIAGTLWISTVEPQRPNDHERPAVIYVSEGAQREGANDV